MVRLSARKIRGRSARPRRSASLLTAANAAGQTVREITVRVAANPTAQPRLSRDLLRPTPRRPVPRTPVGHAESRRGAGPDQRSELCRLRPSQFAPTSLAQPPAATPEPPRPGLAGIAVAHAQENRACGDTYLTDNRGLSSRLYRGLWPGNFDAATAPTARADGRPTPTPILLAYATPADSAGSRPVPAHRVSANRLQWV